MNEKKNDILKSSTHKSIEETWMALKAAIQKGISQFVPVKTTGSKKSLPWLTQEIKRLIRKRDSLYQKQKKV